VDHLFLSLVARQKDAYAKLLHFISFTDRYNIAGLYGLLSSEGKLWYFRDARSLFIHRTDLFEARAILLGRLGRHDQALELYAYRLQDYSKAEECIPFSFLQMRLTNDE
jgi:hypothetical protein